MLDRRLLLCGAAALCFVGFLWESGPSSLASDRSEGQATLQMPPVDLGFVYAWEQRVTVLEFANDFDEPMQIESVFVDCGCMEVLGYSQGVVEPGARATVDLVLAPKDSTSPGPVERNVIVRLVDRERVFDQPVLAHVLGEPERGWQSSRFETDAEGGFKLALDYTVPSRDPERTTVRAKLGSGAARLGSLVVERQPNTYLAAHFTLRLEGTLPRGLASLPVDLGVEVDHNDGSAPRHPQVLHLMIESGVDAK